MCICNDGQKHMQLGIVCCYIASEEAFKEERVLIVTAEVLNAISMCLRCSELTQLALYTCIMYAIRPWRRR